MPGAVATHSNIIVGADRGGGIDHLHLGNTFPIDAQVRAGPLKLVPVSRRRGVDAIVEGQDIAALRGPPGQVRLEIRRRQLAPGAGGAGEHQAAAAQAHLAGIALDIIPPIGAEAAKGIFAKPQPPAFVATIPQVVIDSVGIDQRQTVLARDIAQGAVMAVEGALLHRIGRLQPGRQKGRDHRNGRRRGPGLGVVVELLNRLGVFPVRHGEVVHSMRPDHQVRRRVLHMLPPGRAQLRAARPGARWKRAGRGAIEAEVGIAGLRCQGQIVRVGQMLRIARAERQVLERPGDTRERPLQRLLK